MEKISSGTLAGYKISKIKMDVPISIISPNGKYIVKATEKGVRCSCPSMKWHGWCKHAEYVKLKVEKQGKITRFKAAIINDELWRRLGKFATRWEPAGSYRRGKEYIKDLDIVIIGKPLSLYAELLKMDNIVMVNKGEKIIRFFYKHVPIDMIFTTPWSWGCCMLYRTGPKELNIKMRSKAKKMGMTLNEYGLLDNMSGVRADDKTEEGIFKSLEMKYLSPGERG